MANKHNSIEDSENSHIFKIPEFTKEMKETYTIISTYIFPMHMLLIEQIFLMYGSSLKFLRYTGKKVIDILNAYGGD